jgi:thiosulfate reductase cytochrome b subunit
VHAAAQAEAASAAAPAAPSPAADAAPSGERALRRGLPRVAGGEAWPPPGLFASRPEQATAEAGPVEAMVQSTEAEASAAAGSTPVASPAVAAEAPAAAVAVTPAEASAPAADLVPAGGAASAVAVADGPRAPLPFTPTVWAGAAAQSRPAPRPEPKRIGPFTRLQWAGAVIVGGGGLLYAAALAVLAVRWLLSTEWGGDFLAAYPGEYHLPEGAPVGFPAWLGWQHFFNVFLMVLIIRSGLQVRTEKRPTAFWSPRTNAKRKISLNLWFHQSLDILWIVNGVIFVVLLFVTGQWMRIIPTSWEVFPNAVSAALQYVSLDWPTENGWVNYNALQQLAYFTTVFVAAPLAIVTGVRMSGVWPKNAKALNKAYPVEWARAVHFPVMLYFVLFIFVHVVLVFATGALRNLNHMYAAQGSVDPDAYADNWAGFWIFAVSMLVIAGAWVAARPLVLAPIARLFGKVSGR